MTLHNFRNLLQVGDDFRILGAFRQGDAHKGAYIQAQGLGFYLQAGTRDDTVGLQTLEALVNGGTGNAAFAGNFQKRHTGILDKVGQDFLVHSVDVVTGHTTYILKLTATKIQKNFIIRVCG